MKGTVPYFLQAVHGQYDFNMQGFPFSMRTQRSGEWNSEGRILIGTKISL